MTTSAQAAAGRGRLAGRVALVTGAAGRDIGKHTAIQLAAEGARVVLTDRSAFRLERMREAMTERYGPQPPAFELDLRDRDRVGEIVRAIEAEVGAIDILVNNAAITAFGDVVDTPMETWDELVQVDFTAPWMLVKAVAPGMKARGHGSIVNITSVAAYVGGWNEGLYGALKAALQSLTRDVAFELGKSGIRCNCVAPGIVDSKFIRDNWHLYEDKEADAAMGRFPTSEEVANTVAFLASDEASGITGTVINVSAGWYMTP
ncbi:SDR family NAD(P)-dependent oxidoreductase [Capillimicrobium parvum]|uniref:3-oxoacyl-[acyl-carrier-protein] reductase FabG n=1 Tax=Capillimicrobium parvum TaxID=2884022 RepID=A0A9E6XRQ2_9ACTN|nr:SDR family oxidoreductase [Capillimicrobium parvum]UGS33664.1 3-oxoacyl-[acyl-carrier-protein] reductase FabG [Capillimicrobium parvum]